MRFRLVLKQILLVLVTILLSPLPCRSAEAVKAEYRGWTCTALRNGLVEVHVVPELGGRVMQFRLGEDEFLWVNPQLAGKRPPAGGLGPGGTWLNYGGDKLWPAPQGWDNDRQWPGPPDAVLDGPGPTHPAAVSARIVLCDNAGKTLGHLGPAAIDR